MFSENLITIAGRSITITSHDMLMMIVSVVTGLLFWTAPGINQRTSLACTLAPVEICKKLLDL